MENKEVKSENNEVKPEKVEVKPEPRVIGLDVGTMNLVAAFRNNKDIVTKTLRNVFLEIDSESVNDADLSEINHVVLDDTTYILADDAFVNANIFNKSISRPMKKGVISLSEIDSVDIMAIMIKSLIGKGNKGDICCYSIPASDSYNDSDITYHENTFKRIVKKLGYKPVSLNEASAIIYSECKDSNFSGLAISCGAGMVNVALVYKANPICAFSIKKSGDWIDESSAQYLKVHNNKITKVKESSDFSLLDQSINLPPGKKGKKEKRVREIIADYYFDMIDAVTEEIEDKMSDLEVDLPESIPIIISGGTTLDRKSVV